MTLKHRTSDSVRSQGQPTDIAGLAPSHVQENVHGRRDHPGVDRGHRVGNQENTRDHPGEKNRFEGGQDRSREASGGHVRHVHTQGHQQDTPTRPQALLINHTKSQVNGRVKLEDRRVKIQTIQRENLDQKVHLGMV